MPSDFIPYQNQFAETREESLSRQFYAWEQCGRGWCLFEHPVEIEPPLVPLYYFDIQAPIIDDGSRASFFSALFGSSTPDAASGAQNRQLAEYQEYLRKASKPLFCRYYNQEFTELRLILPKDFNGSKTIAENLILSFAYASHPVSFEVIGTEKETVIQIAATETDAMQVRQQIKSHLPGCSIVETNDFLTRAWREENYEKLVVDFGLSNEFMLPVHVSGNRFENDILTTITGALGNLQQGEVGIFQVVFQKTKQNWAEEIINSVRCFDGTPFFANAPEMIPLAKQKVSRPLFAAVIRIAAKSLNKHRTMQLVKSLGAALTVLASPMGNEFIPLSNDGYYDARHEQVLINRQSCRPGMILSSEELVSLVHPPSSNIISEKLVRDGEKTKPAPNLALHNSLSLGENTHQNETRMVSLSNDQRTKHLHLIGASGSGKSTLLLHLIKQDLANNHGLCVIDPHGDLIDEVIANVPDERLKDTILFDPSDSEFPIGFNILQAHSELEKNLLASDLIATFRRMATSWGDVMDSVLANAILAFVESRKGGTLFDLRRFLVEKDFRQEFLETVSDDSVRYFWEHEFVHLTGKPQSSILIRLDSFLRNRLIRNIVCQKQTRLDFRKIMDNRQVLLIKLSQGLIGEENAYLLGTLLVSKLYQTALSRQDSQERPFFWLYLDEFHHFITPSMENILSGVRKYNIGLHLAHQEFRQLQSRSAEVASSVLANCYTRICFRLGDTDAEKFASGFSFFDAKALQNLGVGEAIGRIERADYDFNLRTGFLTKVSKDIADRRRSAVMSLSREKYGTPKKEVETSFGFEKNRQTVLVPPIKAVSNPVPKVVDSPPPEKTREGGFDEKPAVFPDSSNTAAAASLPQSSKAGSDRNNQQHRYLQLLVKRIAENKGFRCTIEKEVFGGVGRIDVALETESVSIACEISVTNEPDYEFRNIRKALTAGFMPVVMISADARHLEKIRRHAEKNLSPYELSNTKFFLPQEFHLWMEGLESDSSENQKKVKGFKVNVKLKPVDEGDQTARKKAITDVVLGGLKNLKKDDSGK